MFHSPEIVSKGFGRMYVYNELSSWVLLLDLGFDFDGHLRRIS